MLTLMVEGDEVTADDLPASFTKTTPATPAANDPLPGESLPDAVARFERDLLLQAIARAGGVKARAGRDLGVDWNRMKYLCRKYGL